MLDWVSHLLVWPIPNFTLTQLGGGKHQEFLRDGLTRIGEHSCPPRSHHFPGALSHTPTRAYYLRDYLKEKHTKRNNALLETRSSGSACAESRETTRSRSQVATTNTPTVQKVAGTAENPALGAPAPLPTPRARAHPSWQGDQRSGVASPGGHQGLGRSDKVDRRFLPPQLRPPSHIP